MQEQHRRPGAVHKRNRLRPALLGRGLAEHADHVLSLAAIGTKSQTPADHESSQIPRLHAIGSATRISGGKVMIAHSLNAPSEPADRPICSHDLAHAGTRRIP